MISEPGLKAHDNRDVMPRSSLLWKPGPNRGTLTALDTHLSTVALNPCVPVAGLSLKIIFTGLTISFQAKPIVREDRPELFSENDMRSAAKNDGQIGNWIREPWLNQWSHQSGSHSEIWCYVTIQDVVLCAVCKEEGFRLTCHTSVSVKLKTYPA